ncbi:MAG TPA: adenine phosphoribosyltransferase [Bacteroidia bacterium]|nr:adenine phosphoribosyltransferase [Bacteroidia bacterium]
MQLTEKIKDAIRDVPDFPKPGILFKDITPIFLDAKLCNEITDAFCRSFSKAKPDAIIGIESRGFLFGMLMASWLNIPFIMVRKVGKLPGKTVSQTYDLEYGSAVIEVHDDVIKKGWNIVIHDDLLATGGTAQAAAEIVKKCGANVAGFTFVVELEFLKGKEKLINYSNNIQCLVQY